MKNELDHSNLIPHSKTSEVDFFANCFHLTPWDNTSDPLLLPDKQVVTCFLERDNKFLVLQRGKKDSQYQLWGIPGGKLSPSESPLKGLQREIFEETGAHLDESCFTYLHSALSKTISDGKYGLRLYYAEFPSNLTLPTINLDEHLSYQWVTLEEFINLKLLHAQREAFLLVQSLLLNKLNKKDINYARR